MLISKIISGGQTGVDRGAIAAGYHRILQNAVVERWAVGTRGAP